MPASWLDHTEAVVATGDGAATPIPRPLGNRFPPLPPTTPDGGCRVDARPQFMAGVRGDVQSEVAADEARTATCLLLDDEAAVPRDVARRPVQRGDGPVEGGVAVVRTAAVAGAEVGLLLNALRIPLAEAVPPPTGPPLAFEAKAQGDAPREPAPRE